VSAPARQAADWTATAKWRVVIELFAITIVYALVAKLGLALAIASDQVSVIWPASGLGLAALVLRGRRLWPAIAIGSLVANLTSGAPVTAALGIGAGDTLEALAGAAILARLGFDPALKRLHDVAALFLFASALAPIIGATIGVASLALAGVEPWSRYRELWSLWWFGDMLGVAIVAPFLFAWADQIARGLRLERLSEGALLTAALALLSAAVFVRPQTSVATYPVYYLIFPAAIWCSLRLGQHATATLAFGAAAVCTAGTLAGRGPFVGHLMNTNLLNGGLFMAVVSVTGLVLGAVMAERNRAERRRGADFTRLLRSEERLAQANDALTRQARQLAEADRRKDEFLAVLGHELRNPLAPLQHGLELTRRSSDQQTLAKARAVMERQLRHLVRLVDDLLDVSRIRSGKIVLAIQHLELATAVHSAVELAAPVIDAREHRLMVNLPTEPVWLDADPTRLPQLLANLLNNAAKYTPDGGEINLSGQRVGSEVVVRVRDNGIGMSASELASVFELFAQARGAEHTVQGGLGVGLSLAKSLAELHGGGLTAYSAGVGRGSEFVLRLPAARGPDPAAREHEPARQPATARAQAAAARRVLVVDDNIDAAESLALLLLQDGYETATAHGGRDALVKARTFKPEIMILDLGMPVMDGFAVAREVRTDPALKQIRLLALSGYGQPEDRSRTAEAGFDAHLVKPVDSEQLSAVLSEGVAQR
jgi:signal transduction histidine kinase/ActR/RegA family two-component response regulator